MRTTILFFICCLTSCLNAHYDIDDTLLYKIDFKPFSDPKTSLKSPITTSQQDPVEADGNESSHTEDKDENSLTDTVIITSVDKEKFRCQIPKVVQRVTDDISDYTGPDALGLLESLFVGSSCAYRAEPYWTYELCHGKHLRQYHEEREGKQIKLQEYFLGKFNKNLFEELVAEHKKDVANGITRHPPTKMIEKMAMPYYEISMTDGTMCDLTKLPRRTRVLYTCYPNGRNEIYSFKEISTCDYEVVVLTATLCKHPSFRPAESKENMINCQPLSVEQTWKPKRLQQIEIDSLKLRAEGALEAHMTPGDKPGQVKIEIRPVGHSTATQAPDKDLDIDLEDSFKDLDSVKDTIKRLKESQWKASNKQPFKPLMDPEVVKQFLKGDYCLYGGTGWWKYEFCYGKTVDQYHEEGGGKRTVINLGVFSEEAHLAWLEKHPAKKPKEAEARKQVSVFYSAGDVCDLTGKPRQIEVKLKCKTADSPSTVTLYLLEPKTCEYVLGVESPLVCDLLPHADPKTGLFPVEIVDTLGRLESREIEEESSVKKEDVKETAHKIPQKLTSTRITKKTSHSSINTDQGESSTRVVEESVEEVDGVKTTVRRVIVDGLIVDEERISEQNGIVTEHSQVVKENLDINEEAGEEKKSDEVKDEL